MLKRHTSIVFPVVGLALGMVACGSGTNAALSSQDAISTATPIKHLVVIYNENVSFDHYFATYPVAANIAGEPAFTALTGTPAINGLSGTLLSNNPNFVNTAANGTPAYNPFRLDRTQALTSDQNHAYTAEQQAYNAGAMNAFPKYTGKGSTPGAGAFGSSYQVLGYYDGNTVTALWNYAQHFAMSDNAYTTDFGPSTPGALDLVSGQLNGLSLDAVTMPPFTLAAAHASYYVNDGRGGYTMINDVQPTGDVCTSFPDHGSMQGNNIGDLLTAANITWGGFMSGFNLSETNANGSTGCQRSTYSPVVGLTIPDYLPHHNWFQYYATTANPKHLRPTSTAAIGYTTVPNTSTIDPANHEYDSDDFIAAVKAGNFPSVSFIKAPAFQDGHAGYSDPLDEQTFTTKIVNFVQQQPDWATTAVIIAYDDSDGWYDHAYTAPTMASFDAQADQLNGAGKCGGAGTLPDGVNGLPVNGRCGPGTRLPFLVISPWARSNYVDHTLITHTAVTRFIEDNWLGGQRLGKGSADATAGSILGMFNFSGAAPGKASIAGKGSNSGTPKLFVDQSTGLPISESAIPAI